MSRTRVGVVAALVLVLGGCATTVPGTGEIAHSPTAAQTPGFLPQSDGPSSGAPSPTRSPVPARFRRTPRSTALGDPPTAALCKAIDIDPLRTFGLTPTLSDYQTPPDCLVHLSKGGKEVGTVTAYGIDPTGDPHGGAKTETVSGLRVYVYPFQSTGDICQRDIIAQGIDVEIYGHAITGGPGKVDTSYVCRAADAMTDTVASAVAARSVPRFALASPSVGDLDFCKVARAAGLAHLPTFAHAKVETDGVSAGCALTSTKFSAYLDFSVLGFGQAKNTKTVTSGGHQFEVGEYSSSTYCMYTAPQQPIGGGFAEAVTATASSYDDDHGAACRDTLKLAASFLTTAGLT